MGGGGTTGGGAAALNPGAPHNPFAAADFEAKRLTPAEYASLEGSALVGVGLAAPTASGSGGEAAKATGPAIPSAGGAAWKRRIDPRHRRAVSKFFDR